MFFKENGLLVIIIFHTPHFPHFSFSTLRIFHTPHFPHSALSTLRTPRFPPNQKKKPESSNVSSITLDILTNCAFRGWVFYYFNNELTLYALKNLRQVFNANQCGRQIGAHLFVY